MFTEPFNEMFNEMFNGHECILTHQSQVDDHHVKHQALPAEYVDHAGRQNKSRDQIALLRVNRHRPSPTKGISRKRFAYEVCKPDHY